MKNIVIPDLPVTVNNENHDHESNCSKTSGWEPVGGSSLVLIHHCKSSLSFPARLACPARKAVTAYNLLYIL